MSKITGAEYKRFVSEPWPDDAFMDDVLIQVNGVDWEEEDDMTIADDAVVEIIAGVYYEGDKDRALSTEFARWRKRQAFCVIAVEAPKEQREAIEAAVKAAGGKIL